MLFVVPKILYRGTYMISLVVQVTLALKSTLKNFAEFIEKNLCCSLYFNKNSG